jgi:hypothetical protein
VHCSLSHGIASLRQKNPKGTVSRVRDRYLDEACMLIAKLDSFMVVLINDPVNHSRAI